MKEWVGWNGEKKWVSDVRRVDVLGLREELFKVFLVCLVLFLANLPFYLYLARLLPSDY